MAAHNYPASRVLSVSHDPGPMLCIIGLSNGVCRHPAIQKESSATQKKKPLCDILCVFRLLANYTQLNVSFQIHYVA